MPGSEKDWLNASRTLMGLIRNGEKQFMNDMGPLAISLIEGYDHLAAEENWGPMSGQRRKQIEKWLGPEMMAIAGLKTLVPPPVNSSDDHAQGHEDHPR